MNEMLAPLFNLLPAMWERRWWGLAVAWVVAILGALGVLAYKERYQATAMVYVDTQTTLRPLLEGLSVQPDLSQQVALLAQTLLSRDNVITIMDRNHLLAPGATNLQRELLIQNLQHTIHLKINGRDNIYQVSYIGHDPAKTLGVVRSLMDLFVDKGLAGNQQEATQALSFIDSQIAIYKNKLQQAQARLQAFSNAHPGFAPQTGAEYVARMGQLEDQLTGLEGQLSAAQSSRATLQAQLTGTSPGMAVTSQPGAAAISAPSELDVQIAAQQRRLDDLLQRYTDAYPDVIAARQTLARLEAEKRNRPAAAPGVPAAPRVGEIANPVYQQLRVSLVQANANVAALQAQAAEVRASLQRLRSRQAGSSQVDAEYQQLTRDYGVLNDNYQKLVQRRESATLARNQEQSRRSDYFRIVDPPRLGPTALFPHRTFLIALVLVVAAAFGVGATYILSLVLPTYRTTRQLRETTERAVLGAVSLVMTPDAQRRESRQNLMFMTGASLLVLVFVAWTLASVLHLIH